MEKKKGNKILVLGIVFFFIWMIAFLTMALVYQNGDGDFKQFALSHVVNIKEYLSFAHFANWKEVTMTLGCYFLILCVVIITLLWITYCIKAKQTRKIMGWIICIIFLLTGVEAFASFYPYTGADAHATATAYLSLINHNSVLTIMKVLVVLLLLCAFLTTLFGIIFGCNIVYRLIRDVRKAKLNDLEETLQKEAEEEKAAEESIEETTIEEEKHENDKKDIDDIAELIRQIVREELDKKATTSPQIVQNFYGYVPENIQKEKSVEEVTEEIVEKVSEELSKKDEEVVEETHAEVAAEEVKEEAAIEEVVVESIVKEEAATTDDKKPIIRIPFQQRMIDAEKEMKDNYNELKNELLSWGLKSRISNSGDTFRLHCKTYCKLTIAGRSLKLYLALNPDEYDNTTLPFQNVGEKNIYKEIPLAFKVRSGLSMRRAKALIRDACEKDGLEQDTVLNTDWAEDLKNNYVESALDDDDEIASEGE